MSLVEFDMNELKKDTFTLSISGSTNTGKSTLLYYILDYIKEDYKFVYFITTNNIFENNSILNNFIWKFHTKILNLKKPKEVTLLLEQLYAWTDKNVKNDKTLVIFDDIGCLLKDNIYQTITKARHIKMSMIFLLHEIYNIAKNERKQLTYKCFTESRNLNLKRDLDLSDTDQLKTELSVFVKDINNSSIENNQKIYTIFTANNYYYYLVIPDEFIERLKKNEVSTLVYQESKYKDYIKEEINKIIDDYVEKENSS